MVNLMISGCESHSDQTNRPKHVQNVAALVVSAQIIVDARQKY